MSRASCSLTCQNKAAAAAVPSTPRLSLMVFAATGERFASLLKTRVTSAMASNLMMKPSNTRANRMPNVPWLKPQYSFSQPGIHFTYCSINPADLPSLIHL